MMKSMRDIFVGYRIGSAVALKKGQTLFERRHLACIVLAMVGAQCQEIGAAAFRPDRTYFFKHCARTTNFAMVGVNDQVVSSGTSQLTKNMREAIGGLLDAWEREGDTEPRRLAYILATARRESMGTWRPVREAPKCKEDETCRERVIGKFLTAKAAKYGRPTRPNYAQPAPNGRRYYGRGYIQLTFVSNYHAADRHLHTGAALHDNPDKVMELPTAQLILIRGMLEGWFGTRRPLSYYLGDHREDWIHARDNVSPHSDNKPITAESAKEIRKCLRQASAG